MRRPTLRRNAVAGVAMTVTFSLGMALAVFVAGSASAASKTTRAKTTTRAATTTPTATTTPPLPTTTTSESPGDSFFVINGTVNAASDHEIVGSSAFPNFTKGAVDNYYSMAHSHVDNSPFAEGTASPVDTGPIGQTAAAGNFQQPQYADARWPGSPDKATYGTKGQPYAEAAAGEYRATADASEASNGLSGPGLEGKKTLAAPTGFDLRLRQALADWRKKWQGPLGLKKPAAAKKPTPTVTTPNGTVTVPKPPVTVPQARVTTPTAAVTTPLATVTTPVGAGGGNSAPPPVTVPPVTLPSAGAQGAPRSLASLPLPPRPQPSRSAASGSAASGSTPADGGSLLTSSTSATLVETGTKTGIKTYALVTSGESSLGRVSLGGGQIVIEGIHVTASITNDGSPSYKAAVSVASASIGGVPVTIDQDGVHIAGQGQGLPYQQASDGLNGALKQAGVQLFLVGPEVTTNSCGQSGTAGGTGTGTGGDTTTTTTTTTTTGSSDQSGTGGSATSSCSQPDMSSTCGQSGTGTGGGTGPAPTPTIGTTTTSTDRSGTTTTPSSSDRSGTTESSCGGTGMTTPAGSCSQTGTGSGTTTTAHSQGDTTSTSTAQTDTTTTTGSSDQMGLGSGTPNSGQETVTATGVHVVFTQPVSQPGVPAQYVEHIFGEVFVDSLAVPATPLANLGFSSTSSSSSSPSSCPGVGHSGGTASGGASTAVGSSSAGGSNSSGSLSPSGSAFGSASQPTSSSSGSGNSLPAAFAAALRKPLWLLLAYVLWQALVVGTGASLWNWRRGEAS